jgi:glycosyltransferase involved in cell wall biosynthesis
MIDTAYAGPAQAFLDGPKKHVHTLTVGAVPHSYDGSSYYRIWLPFKHLDEQSLHVVTGVADPQTAGKITAQDAASFDVLAVQRPAGKAGMQLLERLAGQTRLVYEVDDDMLNVESAGLPHLYDERLKESVRRCMRMVDMITVSSNHLGEIVAPYCDNVVVLPNFVKEAMLDIRRPKRERLTIGFAGGTSHAWDVEEFRIPVRNILHCNSDVEVHFIGADHSPILGRQCPWTKWEADVGHYYKNIDFDIALAPSADHLFNRSKTPIRALEMAALGIPIVASNRLPYSDFVKHGETGFLVDSDRKWEDAIQQLINDEVLRAEMGAAAKEQAAGLTIEGNWHLWEAAYEKAAAL